MGAQDFHYKGSFERFFVWSSREAGYPKRPTSLVCCRRAWTWPRVSSDYPAVQAWIFGAVDADTQRSVVRDPVLVIWHICSIPRVTPSSEADVDIGLAGLSRRFRLSLFGAGIVSRAPPIPMRYGVHVGTKIHHCGASPAAC